MNIVFWVNQFPVVSETFIRDQIIGLKNKGINPLILVSYTSSDTLALKGFENYNLLENITEKGDLLTKNKIKRVIKALLILLKNINKSSFFYYLKSLNVIKLKKESLNLSLFYLLHYLLENKIEVIHAHFGNNGEQAAIIKSLGVPIKLITTFHGYDIRAGISKGGIIYKNLKTHGDVIIAISPYNKEKLIGFGFDSSQLVSINNGINTTNFKPSHIKSTSDSKIKIISVGRLVEIKGFDMALYALKNVLEKFDNYQIEYTIIGEGHQYNILNQIAIELNISNQVVFKGALSSEQISNQLKHSDFYLLSSRNEAIPTVVLEAQACALPVVATNVGSVKDVVLEGVNGYLAEVNIESITEALLKMIDNKNNWKTFGNNSRELIDNQYSYNSMLEKLIQLYKS